MVRIKHRYLVLNILFPEPPKASTSDAYTLQTHNPIPTSFKPVDLLTLIRSSVAELFGDYGVGSIASGLKITYLSPATGTAIVRCPRNGFRMVWASLSFVKVLRTKEAGRGRDGGTDCVIRVVRVSGTIRKAEEEVVRRARRDIVRMKEVDGERGSHVEKLLGSCGHAAAGDGDEDEAGIEDLSVDEDEMDEDSG